MQKKMKTFDANIDTSIPGCLGVCTTKHINLHVHHLSLSKSLYVCVSMFILSICIIYNCIFIDKIVTEFKEREKNRIYMENRI